jgi:hypothetical protein
MTNLTEMKKGKAPYSPKGKTVAEEQSAKEAARVTDKRRAAIEKGAIMPDLLINKGGNAHGDVRFIPEKLNTVRHAPQTELTIYAYYHLCAERGLTPGEAWISKEDINKAVIVSERKDASNRDITWSVWFNYKTGQNHPREYKQDTYAQYPAYADRYAIIAEQR